ncbi:MAG: DUF655 domain-containing protein [Thermoplasmata archaeon]|nr:DUF655 domain-containing protein [Thermoplasmata archaeon]
MESHVYLLDALTTPRGSEPIALAIGASELKLFELVLRPGPPPAAGSRMELGSGPGSSGPVDHVRRRIGYEELTAAARTQLAETLPRLVLADPARYLRFFNEAPAISRRLHVLELLPGIGKKTMQALLDERRRATFTSFADIEARLHLKNPERLIAERIERELSHADEKYRLFVVP